MLFLASAILPTHVDANASSVVSIYVDGQQRVVTTDADTVGEVLDRAGITIGEKDLVEPALDAEITNQVFNINVYRSRPVLLVDGDREYRIESAYQNPRLIAEHSGVVKVYDEDRFEGEVIQDIVEEGYIGYKVVIDRAAPVKLVIGGQSTEIRTQATTVGSMLKQAGISTSKHDVITPGKDVRIAAGMKVAITRIGFQTLTVEEKIPAETQTIYDNNRPIGYEEVQTAGKSGVALVTYKIEYRNAEEVERKQIRRIVDEEPRARVVVIGNKQPYVVPNYASGNTVWDRLAQCESSGNWSEGPYTGMGNFTGGLQFTPSTWLGFGGGAYAPSAHLATREQQIEIAKRVQGVQGWGAWPRCAAMLGLY